MRVERALLEELSEKVFNIGYQGELNHTQVIISCPVMFRDYPDAVASMVVKPPQGDLYPVSLTRDGNDLTWDVSASDVAIPGAGILQLTFTDGEGEEAEIIKTVYGAYSVNASLVANGEAPDPVQSWLDEAGAALATFENEIGDIRKITTATESDEGLALSPKTVVNGKVTEWEYIDLADPEVVTQAIDDWLDDHPEATTTVQDGAITEAKLNDSLKEDLAWQDDVDELKSALGELSGTWTAGKTVYPDGTINNATNVSIVEVNVIPGTKIKGYVRARNVGTSMAFYGIDGSFKGTAYNDDLSTYDWYYEIVVPADAYRAIFSCYTGYEEEFSAVLLDLENSVAGKIYDFETRIVTLEGDAETLHEFGDVIYQYIDHENYASDKYWFLQNGSIIEGSANGYKKAPKVEGLKAGTYNFSNINSYFSYIKKSDGTITNFIGLGFPDTSTLNGSYTFEYDFDLYVTVINSNSPYAMFANGELPPAYKYGAYSVDLDTSVLRNVIPNVPIYCGATRKYTTLKSAIEEAVKYMDSVVYVDEGTYDLVSEFGSEWLEAYDSTEQAGLFLKNRVHIIFSEGAKVTFNYTGNNPKIKQYFSPFNAGEYGFTIENLHLEDSNDRYCVHDERGNSTDNYQNNYINCVFHHDNRNNDVFGVPQCIGGGLGKNGTINIIGCRGESLPTFEDRRLFTYHNNSSANSFSVVNVKDCYLQGTVAILGYGSSTVDSEMYVSNCSLLSAPVIDTTDADNVALYAWNNEIRN